MATTPEEFFIKDLMEHPPPSPPVFIDFPQKPNGSSERQHQVPNNDMVLPYISRVLMEDSIDVDDELIDHPTLLETQQPFAQILSSPSFNTNTGNTEGVNHMLQEGDGDENTLNLALSKGTDTMCAFFKSMEEANMLLPKGNNFRRDEPVKQMVSESCNNSGVKKRYNRDHHLEEVRKSSKPAVVVELKENCAGEMLDEMMLHGYETCVRSMEKLRVSMDNEQENKNKKSGSNVSSINVVDIQTLLIHCAQEVAADNRMAARGLLEQIKQHASETGDATQRLAQYFTKGLEARLVGTGSLLWQLLTAEPPSVVEFLKAYNLYSAACCYHNVAIMFSKITIMQAMVGKSRLHIVDYGMCFGFHWSSLLHLLATRDGVVPEVKITAIGRPKQKSWPAEQIEEIGCRLSKCASKFGLPSFKFHAIMTEWEDASIKDLNKYDDEVLVVNDLFKFSTLMDESVFFDLTSPRDTVLNNIKNMRPDVFIQSITNQSYGSSFVSRFREALFYNMALFDMLDATTPRQNKYRLVLEDVLLGRSAVNTIACEGLDLMERPEKYRQCQARNQRAGLRQLPLKSSIVDPLKDMVEKNHHKDFLICKDGKWLLQGWKGRVLFAHSTWVAEDDSS